MKFGKRLRTEAHAQWLDKYIDYNRLKANIKNDPTSSAIFESLLFAEIDKTNQWSQYTTNRLMSILAGEIRPSEVVLSALLPEVPALLIPLGGSSPTLRYLELDCCGQNCQEVQPSNSKSTGCNRNLAPAILLHQPRHGPTAHPS